jgi:integrase
MVALAAEAKSDAERERWIKMELALVLAEATGRRLGSIRALRWEDIDLITRRIRWRADADKKGVEWSLPIPESLANELRDFQRRLSAVGGLVFGSASKPEVAMDRHLFDKWLTVAEVRANLPKLRGALWHSYRRKWASERKHLSLVDVAAAGGWKDTATLLTCYMQPDEATLLRVMSEPRKLVSGVAG